MNAADFNARSMPIVGAVKIAGIRLKFATLTSSVKDPSEVAGTPVLTLETRTAATERCAQGRFSVIADLAAFIRGNSVPQDEPPAVTVRATFEISYETPPEIELGTDDLEQFAKVNGTFNVWPYWREFFQSSLVRMGLPPLQLPVLRGMPKAVADHPIAPSRGLADSPILPPKSLT